MIEPIEAYCVVDKKKPTIKLIEVYDEVTAKSIKIGKDEKIIKVIIKPYDK